jgi:23S rRNA pseudouridine1911/1915/1917 synthase
VHPGSGNWSGTLLNALLHHAPVFRELPRAGIVHRLDKDTSGLLVVAKTLEAQTDLVRQLQARSVKRHYYALVHGEPRPAARSMRPSAAIRCSAPRWRWCPAGARP